MHKHQLSSSKPIKDLLRVPNRLVSVVETHGTDGSAPAAGLVQGSDGSFYGTTFEGGDSGNCDYDGCGTVFKITASGTLTTLHTFGGGGDGAGPYGGLVQANNGFFYGTTFNGGAYGNGTVFRVGLVRTCATCRP